MAGKGDADTRTSDFKKRGENLEEINFDNWRERWYNKKKKRKKKHGN